MTHPRSPGPGFSAAHGFTLVELMIAALISGLVLGTAVTLATGVQRVHAYEVSDAVVQQEARVALHWIGRLLSAAGSNPYRIRMSACPAPGTRFAALRLDPDGDGVHDDVRVQADVGPPNGVLLGLAGACTEPGEDVTIAHDAVNSALTRRDLAIDAAPVAVTDRVFTDLRFTYLTAARAVTAAPRAIAFVQVSLTGRSRSRNPSLGQFTTFTYRSEVRVRAR